MRRVESKLADGTKIVMFYPFETDTPVVRLDIPKVGHPTVTWQGAFMRTTEDAVKFHEALESAGWESLGMCCLGDHNRDGNCHKHSSFGVLRGEAE